MPKLKTKKKISPQKNSSRKKNLAISFIFIGFLFIIIPVIFYSNQTIQLTFFTPRPVAVASPAPSKILPVLISVPSIDLSLPVIGTVISQKRWEIAENGASYLLQSAQPGTKGPIIMYAHNTPDRFGPVRKLTPGKLIILRTTDKRDHIYKITKTVEVYPTEMDIFSQSEETLILYTCSGFADLKRFIVFAKPSL